MVRTTVEMMVSGRRGRVVALHGGRGMVARLESMGIRPGKVIRKLSSQPMGGPVTVLVEGRQVAMGRGIARRVTVELIL